jgi:ATP-binding cassette, subfamily B, bacterial
MIRDAPLLLLDEPTTGLDAASTQRVLAPLRRLMQGRTTIMISHNLLTVADADAIVYLEQGRILGTGTHQQLLASCPGYAHLYRLHHQPAAPRARTGGPAFRPPHPPVLQRRLP